jgi:hypothetical protein
MEVINKTNTYLLHLLVVRRLDLLERLRHELLVGEVRLQDFVMRHEEVFVPVEPLRE